MEQKERLQEEIHKNEQFIKIKEYNQKIAFKFEKEVVDQDRAAIGISNSLSKKMSTIKQKIFVSS